MSTGLLILRVALGALLLGHGTKKLSGWFGGRGLVATCGPFARMGYRVPSLAAPAAASRRAAPARSSTSAGSCARSPEPDAERPAEPGRRAA